MEELQVDVGRAVRVVVYTPVFQGSTVAGYYFRWFECHLPRTGVPACSDTDCVVSVGFYGEIGNIKRQSAVRATHSDLPSLNGFTKIRRGAPLPLMSVRLNALGGIASTSPSNRARCIAKLIRKDDGGYTLRGFL